jgi:hypothetical protein
MTEAGQHFIRRRCLRREGQRARKDNEQNPGTSRRVHERMVSEAVWQCNGGARLWWQASRLP